MYTSTCRSRRHRNVVEEQKPAAAPFFADTSNTSIQAKKESVFFQAKLSVGKPNDKYEKEADSVANTVVSQQASTPFVQQKKISQVQRLTSGEEEEKLSTNDARMRKDKEIQAKPEIQRMCSHCEKEKEKGIRRMAGTEEKEEEKLQAKSESGAGVASSSLSGRIENSAGKGKSLPASTMEKMNSSFGANFSKVNIHTGADAVQMNKELHAQAFTHGNDIYFNAGKFDTGSANGKQLLAHELTHVIQQGGIQGKDIQRQMEIRQDLKAERFKGDADLEGCYDDEARLTMNGQGMEGKRKVEKGPGVKKLKEALVDLGYLNGPVDEVYTEETWNAVKQLKSDKNLGWEHMGDVGPGTMKWLDDHYSTKKEEPPKDEPKEEPKKEEPPSSQKLCGPDVTAKVKDANSRTRKHFKNWPDARKESACQSLVSIFFGLGAWDIVELNESGWIFKEYNPPCASEGADPSCIKSVEVDDKCFYAGSVNYVHFGNMFDLCSGHYAKAYPLNKQFTQNEMLRWINLYKGTGWHGLNTPAKNFKASVDWASAGFFLWPHGALTPDADRANCSPDCPIVYKGKDFNVNWDGENF